MLSHINFLTILSLFFYFNCFSQIQYSSNLNNDEMPDIKNLSGPRIGFSIITNSKFINRIENKRGVKPYFMTQFGYLLEKQVMGDDEMAGLIKGVGRFGGLEYGIIDASMSLMYGLRFKSNFEFSAGPNLSVAARGAGLIISFGKTIKTGKVNIPIDFSWVPSTKRSRRTYRSQRIESDDSNEVFYDSSFERINFKSSHLFNFSIGFKFRTK